MSHNTLFVTFCVTFPEKFKQKSFQITNDWEITNFIKKQYFEEKIKKAFPVIWDLTSPRLSLTYPTDGSRFNIVYLYPTT